MGSESRRSAFALTGKVPNERAQTSGIAVMSALSNALVFGWRGAQVRAPARAVVRPGMTPLIFTLLFTFVFGGALAGSPRDYLQIFLPGILVQTVVFNSVYSGMGLSTDLGKGLFDRFRSLPIWSLAPFAGLMVGDVLRHVIAGGIILSIGLILGYRPEAGVLGVLAAFALLITIGFGTGWIFIVLGLVIPHSMTVMRSAPRSYFAGLRVQHHGRSQTMPGWLRVFVEVNPVSLMTARCAASWRARRM
jgi:ABC-2 type transport system permease protein